MRMVNAKSWFGDRRAGGASWLGLQTRCRMKRRCAFPATLVEHGCTKNCCNWSTGNWNRRASSQDYAGGRHLVAGGAARPPRGTRRRDATRVTRKQGQPIMVQGARDAINHHYQELLTRPVHDSRNLKPCAGRRGNVWGEGMERGRGQWCRERGVITVFVSVIFPTFAHKPFITFAAAFTVCSMSAAVCAVEINPASNCDGARYTPASSIP